MTRKSFPGTVAALVAAFCLGASVPISDVSAGPPGWARGAVLYAAVEGLNGDGFAGVEAQLPELEALGIDAILLWPPVAVRAEGEEYAIVDESGVDPSWGSPDELHRLVDRAHELGLRVLIDVVLNHTSGLAVAAIWLSAVAASVWSPDLITGSAHEHIPLVAINTPIWALLATGFAILAPAVTANDRGRVWSVYAGAVAVAWFAAAMIAIGAPAMVTGTDPTTIPIAGVIAPIPAMAATAYATVGVVAVSARERSIGEAVETAIRRMTEAVPQTR